MGLWANQREGLSLIERQDGTMLAHDMGTGKSRTIVTYVRKHRPRRVLILSPNPVVPVWPSEFRKIGQSGDRIKVEPLNQRGNETVADRMKRAKRVMERCAETDWTCVLVVNYEAAWRAPLGKWLLKQEWDLVVCDESHRIKSPSGRAGRFVRRLRPRAKKRVCLTGTPMPHDYLDIWGQYAFLDPGIFGTSYTRMKARYAVMGGAYINGRFRQIVDWRDLDDLNARYHSIAHRARKIDILDLPPATHQVVPVQLNRKAMQAYEEMERELITMAQSGAVTAANAMIRVLRLQQITSGFVTTEDGAFERIDESKTRVLADSLTDIDAPVVVFCKFRADLDAVHLAASKAGKRSVELSGRRNEIGHNWKPDSPDVAAVQIQAGGTGIDLTASATAFYFSQTHSLGDYDQSLARLHRPGQQWPVNYVHLIASDTVDERIRAALERRADAISFIVDNCKRRKLNA